MSIPVPTLPRPAHPAGGGARPPEALFGGYRAISSGYDEMLGRDGTVQPHYRPLISWLEGLPVGERDARFRSARQYLNEAGVFYRVYGDPERAGELREWPLAQPPLVIAQKEWVVLERGLVQRARLLEAALADLYGERTLIADGTLPAALLGRNPEFLRPLASQGRSGGSLLHFVAFDLGRGPDGRWWVLGDRTQAPSGAGFALENRVATSRAFPDLIGEMRIRRIAGFFSRFRDALYDLTGSAGRRIGLLTPGPHNETYFEHAYLARYLGMLLLEGGDLVVHGDRAEVRTVDGVQPIHILWRRLDADFADPLELFSGSRIGTPGLVRAVRAGNLKIVNALGSGLVEAKALLPFGQALARRLLGEDLALPVIATWWCGEESAAAFVRRHAGELALGSAFPRPAGSPPAPPDEAERLLALDGARIVGQEIARLSTAPVFEGGRLVPRPVTLRVFLARDADGWHVMPGGFARVADQGSGDPRNVSMQAGGRSMDVWIPGEAEERAVTLIGRPDERFQRRLPGALPARAADNLYWLGRYVERCEVGTRLLRLHAARRAASERSGPLDAHLARLLSALGIDVFSDAPAGGLADLATAAAATASRIRERFSPDGWRVLAELVEVIESLPADAPPDELMKLTSRCLTRLTGFTGLVNENMYQFAGWRFLSAGRRLERGQMTARITAALGGSDDPPEGALEALLEFADSRVTFRRRYSVSLSRLTVLDLVGLDPLNPRSIAYQVNGLGDLVSELPGSAEGQSLAPLARRIARLGVRLRTADAAEADAAFLERIAADLADVSDLLTAQYLLGSPGREGARIDTE
ncbi:circularly permuted type 2 ATP-grasp protein [Antarcticirhabdus aurantiaca]|uniref:Circularly permuted type 2 ATP-grasp protein n=1 Tax=Antarcticirhabdus aurantiaca TaxID=2606717 RepID=A0ACD4NIN7_9HYPH|nr:circularly permuted type 2 ATP-grasp protein [Antarcticirhabdus aurantiaca]WAJ26740.1 circularly permuted type 2 ATP-grasp protein [Jeongeuplla avenae]